MLRFKAFKAPGLFIVTTVADEPTFSNNTSSFTAADVEEADALVLNVLRLDAVADASEERELIKIWFATFETLTRDLPALFVLIIILFDFV